MLKIFVAKNIFNLLLTCLLMCLVGIYIHVLRNNADLETRVWSLEHKNPAIEERIKAVETLIDERTNAIEREIENLSSQVERLTDVLIGRSDQ